jgi:hypothetical protein
MIPRWIRPLFIVAALYDFVLGAAYFFFYPSFYAHFGIELPNHPGYYAGIVFAYWARGLMPSMWLIWAVCDTLFLVAFLGALRALPKEASPTDVAAPTRPAW